MRQKIISLVSSDLENGSGMNRKRFGVDSFSPRKLFTLLFVLLLGVGQMWGTEELYYTLTPANGSNNSYASNCDIAISGITWNLEGNSQVQPWKLGANNKTALSNTDRSIYSKTAIDEDITKIEITHGAASNITVNSMTVIVSKNSNFSSPVSTLTPTFAANNTVTVYRPNGKDWSNCYYKITYNLTGAKSSANTIQFTNAKFYHEVGGGSTPTVLDVPTGMSSGTPGMTSTTLSWNAVANASGYALTIGTNSPITSGFTTSAGVVSYNLTGLDAETSYTWKVKAVGDGENYSDSEDCATQNFTTAEDPSQMTLTFGLTSNPGGWPTTNSTTTTNYTYTLNAVNYSFALNNVKCNSGYLMMTKTAILGLPAIANYKLVKVVASNSGGCSTSTNVAITSAQAASPVVTGGTGQTWSSTSSNYTYNLSGTDYNTVYYMYVTSANAQVTQLKLTYKPKPAVSSISIKTAPTKTTYTANENFDPSGLVITVNYDDATSEDVTYGNSTAANFTFSPSTSTALNATNTSVTVTYGTKTANQAITVNRIATSLAWSPTSYTVNYGAVYSFPTLTKTPNNLSGVTYSSSNTDVATINETTGAISVVGTGSTTITASFAQTNVYSAATPATYTLTINSASSPTLEVDPTSLTFDLTAVGSNRTDIVTLEGEFLAANATYEITGDDKAMFSVVDPTFPLTPEGGELLEDITIKYAPTAAAANHTATLTITSGVASATVTLSGSAKVKRTVTWYKADDTELTAQERGSATTEVWDGDAVTVLPSAPASCDASISFQGWTNATYAKSDDAPTILFTDAEDAPEISGGNASYYAVWANTSGSGGNVVINASVDGYPTTYGSKNAFDDLEVSGIDFKIQQLTTNSSNMQWRASGNENGTGTIYNNEAFPGHITSIVVVFASTDANRNHTLKIGDSANPTGGTAITPSISNTYTYTFDCSAYNFDYFVLTNGTNAGYTSSVTINYAASVGDYATTCSVPVVIADPTFSPAAGSYDNDQSVEISAAQGMTIKYSIGADSNPKTNGTTYSSAISVTEDKVIKAVATDGNGNWSNVVTKTYTINYSSSIAAYIAKAQATTRYLRLNAAQNCIITGIREYVSGNNDKWDIYMQDASNKGIIIYGLSALPSGAAVGKRIEGAISGTYSLGNGQPRITSADLSGATFINADALTPASISAVNADAYTVNPVMLVKLSGVYYKEISSGNYIFSENNDGTGTQNTIYDTFKYLNGKTMPANTVACDVTGILINYNGNTPELLPVELTTAATAALPTISPEGGADAEHALEVTYLSEISVGTVADEDITISLNDVEKTDENPILVQGDLKLEVSAKRDFYADNSVTYYYKPSAYPKNISVTSAHGTVVVKVGDNVVETALPGATVNFTVMPENEHFHIASTSVTYEGGSLTPALSENIYSFSMPDKDATIVVNYTEDAKYSITFNGGGAEGEGPDAIEDQYAGTEITLPTKEQANYTAPTDKVFNGWLVTYGENVEVEQNAGKFDMPTGNVTITAQWTDRVYCALTLNINGATSIENIDREVAYVLPTDVDDISGYSFYGWAEAPELDDVEEAIDVIESFTPGANEASKTLYAVFKREYVGEDKEDELTAADFAATSTSYVDFSNVQKVSSAKYAGNSALNNSTNIQLRSSNSNSGIVSTVSGGTIKSVKITVASGSNTIDVYGSNTAYSAASDLYGSSKGTKIEGTSSTKTITPAANYKYVGVRSNSGAVYLSSVTVTWTPKATYYTTAPAQVYDVEYALGGGAWKENEGCEAAKVKAGQTYSICTDVPVLDHYTFAKWQIGGVDASGDITISDNTTITAVWNAKAKSNVTYNAGTGSGDPVVVSNVEEGTEVTLKAIGSGEGQANFTKDGYNFVGWLSNGVLRKAGETFDMPAAAVTWTAQWKKQNMEQLTLVKSASQLLDGMKVVLANQDAEAVAGASAKETDTYLASETGTFNGDKSQITDIGDGIKMTLVQVEGGWALKYNNKYLKPYSSNKISWDASPTTWTITFDGNDAKIETASSALRYNGNSGSERFAAYTTKTSCNPLQLYAELTVVSANANVSDLGYVDGDVIVLSNNATLTVDADIAPTTMIVSDGSTVTVNNDKTVDANTLIVERNGTLDIQTNGTVNTDETFVIYSTLGKGTGTQTSGNAPGSCSQIKNAHKIAASGNVFFELDLTQDAAASQGWYAFSVPFPVDAMNGVYYKDTKLTNETHYAIMAYHGDKRAAGEYAWKKYRDIMQPGVLYIISVGDTDFKTLRFKKHGNDAFSASTNVEVKRYYSEIDAAYAGWNGIGNPNMQISYLPETSNVYYMQFLIHEENRFQIRTRSNINLVVGSAFFIQYRAADGQINIATGVQKADGGYLAPARHRNAVEERIYEVSLINNATGEIEDNVFMTAREEATNSYEIGRDVAKMSMGNAKCAQMTIPAYGKQLGAADFPLINGSATYPLSITAPAAGEYTISSDAMALTEDGSQLYLTYNGQVMWNLTTSPMTVTLPKGNSTQFGLLITRPAMMPTGMDEVTGDGLQVGGVEKLIIDDHIYILRDGKMYDVTGKAVR